MLPCNITARLGSVTCFYIIRKNHMPQLRALHHPLWSLPTQKHSIDRDGISNVVILISGIVIVWPSKRRETMSYTPYHNTLTGVEMFPSSTLDAMASAYSRHPLLLSLFTGAMETKNTRVFHVERRQYSPWLRRTKRMEENRKRTRPVLCLFLSPPLTSSERHILWE